jgi:LPXTG-site transpeptidase (sortase) family protein
LLIGGVVGLALLAATPLENEGQLSSVDDQAQSGAQAQATPETPAGEQTASPPVVPTAASELEPPGNLVMDERFTDNRRYWPDNPLSTAWIAAPGYRLMPREPGKFVAVSAPVSEPLTDVVVTATFRKLGGPPGGGYGVIVRGSVGDGINQSGSYYVLEAGDRGQIGIWRRDSDRWVDLMGWTDSGAILQGDQTNTLQMWAVGTRLSLWANGSEVASVFDDALSSGGVGVFAGGDGNDVQVDRFVVRALSQATLETAVTPTWLEEPPEQQAATTAIPVPTAAVSPTSTPFRPITRVVIPSISLDAPSVPTTLVTRDGATTWDVPRLKIGHAVDTGGAGSPGNAVLVGHVTSQTLGNVFQHLHEVTPGALIEAFSAGQEFDYRVTSVRTVSRSDLSVVQPTTAASLTLITCTGVWLPVVNDYAQRTVVRAELRDSRAPPPAD